MFWSVMALPWFASFSMSCVGSSGGGGWLVFLGVQTYVHASVALRGAKQDKQNALHQMGTGWQHWDQPSTLPSLLWKSPDRCPSNRALPAVPVSGGKLGSHEESSTAELPCHDGVHDNNRGRRPLGLHPRLPLANARAPPKHSTDKFDKSRSSTAFSSIPGTPGVCTHLLSPIRAEQTHHPSFRLYVCVCLRRREPPAIDAGFWAEHNNNLSTSRSLLSVARRVRLSGNTTTTTTGGVKSVWLMTTGFGVTGVD